MAWNGEKANDYFAKKYSAVNPNWTKYRPNNEFFREMHDIDVAAKKIYYECAISAWTKEKLISNLKSIIEGASEKILIPKDVNSPDSYIEAYKGTAKDVLADLESGKLAFD